MATHTFPLNQENPLITYEGLKYRLNLPDDFDFETLIQDKGELFRRGVPGWRLEEWKNDLLTEEKKLPQWIQEKYDKAQQREKVKAIVVGDVFRSQFRVNKNSPHSEISVLEWGLQHIDRLRKARMEEKTGAIKQWEVRLIIGASILSSLISLLAALLKK